MKLVKFGFSLFGINTYLVVDEGTKECAVVDPGMIEPEEENALVDYIEREGLKVRYVINTHLHVDHAIGDRFVVERFRVPVLGHRGDETLGQRMQQQAQMFGMREKLDSVSLTSYLEDGDKLKIGGGELEVLHVPGHSPGSIALYDPQGKWVIAGDALFADSIGRTDLPGGSYDTLVSAIKDKLLKLPDDTAVYPGHGPATTIAHERRYNPYLH